MEEYLKKLDIKTPNEIIEFMIDYDSSSAYIYEIEDGIPAGEKVWSIGDLAETGDYTFSWDQAINFLKSELEGLSNSYANDSESKDNLLSQTLIYNRLLEIALEKKG